MTRKEQSKRRTESEVSLDMWKERGGRRRASRQTVKEAKSNGARAGKQLESQYNCRDRVAKVYIVFAAALLVLRGSE